MKDVAALPRNFTLHNAIDKPLEGLKHFKNVGETKHLEQVDQLILLKIDHWGYGGCSIDKKETFEISLGNASKCPELRRSDEKAEYDFDAPSNLCNPYDPYQLLMLIRA